MAETIGEWVQSLKIRKTRELAATGFASLAEGSLNVS